MYVANVSLSQRSPHQRMVATSPNPCTCAISWRIVSARRCSCASVALPRNTYVSLNVTHPGFSIAPMLNSGTNSWLYSSKGYGNPKYCSKKSSPARVISKMPGACSSTYADIDSRHQMPSGIFPCRLVNTW